MKKTPLLVLTAALALVACHENGTGSLTAPTDESKTVAQSLFSNLVLTRIYPATGETSQRVTTVTIHASPVRDIGVSVTEPATSGAPSSVLCEGKAAVERATVEEIAILAAAAKIMDQPVMNKRKKCEPEAATFTLAFSFTNLDGETNTFDMPCPAANELKELERAVTKLATGYFPACLGQSAPVATPPVAKTDDDADTQDKTAGEETPAADEESVVPEEEEI